MAFTYDDPGQAPVDAANAAPAQASTGPPATGSFSYEGEPAAKAAPSQDEQLVALQRKLDPDYMSPAESKVATRVAAKTAAGIPAAFYDIGALGVNFVKKHVFGQSADDMIPTSNEVVGKAMDKMGLTNDFGPEGQSMETTGATVAGLATAAPSVASAVSGIRAAGRAAAAEGGPASLWTLSGERGGVNQRIFSTAAAKSIGEGPVDKLTSDVFSRARDRMGLVYDNVRSPNHIYTQDPAAISQELSEINSANNLIEPGQQVQRFGPVRELESQLSQGHIDNEKLGNIASDLRKEIESGNKSWGTDIKPLQGVLKLVETKIKEGLSPDMAALYDKTNSEYHNLITLTKNGITNWTSGEMEPGALASVLKSADPWGYATGGKNTNNSDLYNVVRWAEGQQTGIQRDLQGSETYLYRHSKAILDTIARAAPQMVQHVMGNGAAGLKQGLKALINRPGFAQALGTNLIADAGDEDNGSARNQGQ